MITRNQTRQVSATELNSLKQRLSLQQLELSQQQGLLLLDKSPGLSSNMALQKAKRLLGVRKAGHTGSLDPLASGLLPICIGRATRLSSFLLNDDKSYVVEIMLGVSTETGDSEGAIVMEREVHDVTVARLERTLLAFTGEIEQIPPMYSALKYKGKRLYELARQGIEVERKPRKITIHQIALLDYHGTRVKLNVSCSKGTYIRTLAEDIGNQFGCGAHVTSLRRTRVGELDLGAAWTLQQLQAMDDREQRLACVMDADQMLSGWPSVQLTQELAFYLGRGQAVWIPKLPTSGWLRIYSQEGLFLGVGEITDDGKLAPRRLFQ